MQCDVTGAGNSFFPHLKELNIARKLVDFRFLSSLIYTIRYDMILYIYVRSKADEMDSLAHGTETKKIRKN